jgi:hypothetical protein
MNHCSLDDNDEDPPIPEDELLDPHDAPVLLAGLIAARRTDDGLLEDVMVRGLRKHGIVVRFVRTPEPADHPEAADAG